MAFHIVLVEPLIPQNTGSIARLTAATNTFLHLIEPLGFELSDKYLKRAGLDYWPEVRLTVHKNWQEFLAAQAPERERIFVMTKFGKTPYWNVKFEDGDYLVFGNEERGFSPEFRSEYEDRQFVIPMVNANVRSLNLACCASAVLSEGIRQVEGAA